MRPSSSSIIATVVKTAISSMPTTIMITMIMIYTGSSNNVYEGNTPFFSPLSSVVSPYLDPDGTDDDEAQPDQQLGRQGELLTSSARRTHHAEVSSSRLRRLIVQASTEDLGEVAGKGGDLHVARDPPLRHRRTRAYPVKN